MRILYGVVGEGMGHATRSRVVLEHLLEKGHDIRVVVSGRAHRFLTERFADRPHITLQEIHGLHMDYADNRFRIGSSLWTNLTQAPGGILQNVAAYQRIAEDGFQPELVVSDFESWAYLYGLNHRLPVVDIDNQQVINRCRHDPALLAGRRLDYLMTRIAVKAKLPWAYHYLVTSFFFPPGPQAAHDPGVAHPAAGNPGRPSPAGETRAGLPDLRGQHAAGADAAVAALGIPGVRHGPHRRRGQRHAEGLRRKGLRGRPADRALPGVGRRLLPDGRGGPPARAGAVGARGTPVRA
jgi:hypothetical protein